MKVLDFPLASEVVPRTFSTPSFVTPDLAAVCI